MSKRFRTTRPSTKGRLLRPRSERLPRTGAELEAAEPTSSQDIDVAPESAVVETETPASGVVSTESVQQASNTDFDDDPIPSDALAPPSEVASLPAVVESAEPPASLPSGTPRELSAATTMVDEPPPATEEPAPVLGEVTVTAASVEPVSTTLEPAAVSEGGKKKKKKKNKTQAMEAAPAPVVAVTPPPETAPIPPALTQSSSTHKKLNESSSTHKKLSESSSAHKKLSESSSAHKKLENSGSHKSLNESGKHRAVADLDDPMSVEFFSVKPPAVADADDSLDDLNPPPAPPSPAALERQRKARKIVGGVVAAASLVVLFGVGRMLFGGRPADAQPNARSTVAAHEQPKQAAAPVETALAEGEATAKVEAVAAAPATAEATVEASASAPPEASASASASAEASASASAAPAESAVASASASAAAEAPKGTMTPEELKELRKKADRLANAGNNKGAIEAARAVLEQDPTDALMYLYIGSAYMSMGKMPEAKEAFNECVRKGKGGHVGECSAFGGKK